MVQDLCATMMGAMHRSWVRSICSCVAGLLLLPGAASGGLTHNATSVMATTSTAASPSPLLYRTPTFSLLLYSNATVGSFTDLATGVSLAASPPEPFLLAAIGGQDLVAATVLKPYPYGLIAHFGPSGPSNQISGVSPTVNISVRTVLGGDNGAGFLRFDVTATAGGVFDRLVFAQLGLGMPRHGNGRCQNGYPMAPCDYLAAATSTDGAFTAALLPLSPSLEVEVDRTNPEVQVLRATSIKELPLVPPLPIGVSGDGVSAALWSGPTADLHDAIKLAETLFGLPSPKIDGVRARDSPDMLKGYVLESNGNVTAAVAEATAAGLEYVMLLGWSVSDGHYAVRTSVFPDGDAGLKSMVDALHVAGLKAGMHFLSAHVSKDDPYVTPVPDPGLALDAAASLTRPVSATDTFLPLDAPPSERWVSTLWEGSASSGTPAGATAYSFDTRLAVIGGTELVTYDSVNASGLVGCVRGALGSTAVAHPAHAAVGHFAQMYGELLARPGTPLFEKIATRLATLYNFCGFDAVYFDGSEGTAALGSEQIPISQFEQLFFSKLTRGILVEGSSIVPYTWFLNARANTGDYAFLDPKAYMDVIKAAQIAVHRRNQMNPELGWWGFDSGGEGYPATLPDEMEYAASSAVGYTVSPQIEKGGVGNGREMEALGRMKPWSWLSAQTANISAEVMARLRLPNLDFELRAESTDPASLIHSAEDVDQSEEFAPLPGRYWITPVKYHGNEAATHVANAAVPNTLRFSVNAAFPSASRWGCRVRWLPSIADFGDPGNIRVLDPTKKIPATTSSSSGLALVAGYAPATGTPPPLVGAATLHLNVTRVGARPSDPTAEWVQTTVAIAPAVNLNDGVTQDNTAERALGVWIKADGCAATFNLQLSAGIGYGATAREWYVDLNWNGWRLIRFDQSETSRGLFNYSWPYNQEKSQRAWRRDSVDQINLFLSNVTTVSCMVEVGAVEVFAQSATTISGGRLAIGANGPELQLPSLQPGNYVECLNVATPQSCRVFDALGHQIPTVFSTVSSPNTTTELKMLAGPGPIPVSVTLCNDQGHSACRASIIVVEASTERIGPFDLG